MITTAFFDPSARSGKQHDYKAIVVGTLLKSVYYVRYAYIRRVSVQDVLEQLYRIHAEFPGVLIGREENGFQVLYKDLLEYKARDKGYPLPTYGMTSSANKDARIESLSGFVESGHIRFQRDAQGYTSDIGLLVEQMLDFPNGKHDDGPDALKYAFDMAMDKAVTAAYGSRRKSPEDLRNNRRPYDLRRARQPIYAPNARRRRGRTF